LSSLTNVTECQLDKLQDGYLQSSATGVRVRQRPHRRHPHLPNMEDHTHTTHQLSTMSIGQPRDAAADMDVDEDFASGNDQCASMPPPLLP